MKECKIVEDLLPLYADGLLQEETKEFVELHLRTCPACADRERLIKSATVSAPPPKPEEKTRLRRVKRKVQLRALLISAGSLMLAVGVFLAAYLPYYFHKNAVEEQMRLRERVIGEINSRLSQSNVVVNAPLEIAPAEEGDNRANHSGISFCLPTENFREIESGSYGNYEIYEGEEQLTDTVSVVRCTSYDGLSDYEDMDYPMMVIPPSQSVKDVYARGYGLMKLRGVENNYLNLALAAGRFNFDVIQNNPTDDELALALFFSCNYKKLLGNGAAMVRWFQLDVSPTNYYELYGNVSGFLTHFTVMSTMSDGSEYGNSYWRAVLQGADERYYYIVDITDSYSNVAADGWQSSFEQIELLLKSVRFE